MFELDVQTETKKIAVKLGKAEVTRERIMKVAARSFRDKGYTGTTMRDIARRCRMKAGSIYYHFSSKEMLVDSILDIGLKDVRATVIGAVDALPPSATSLDRITTAMHAQLQAMIAIGDYAIASRHVFSQIPAKVRNKHIRLREEFAGYWQSMFIEAQKDGFIDPTIDVSLCRVYVVGAINWSIEWFDPKKKPIDYVADHFVRMALGGFLQGGAFPRELPAEREPVRLAAPTRQRKRVPS
ncbi:AcrR family transcriptional regulator [Rhodoligotrophos appendicifer]|uniref:TetR/AcrR family transcriptional regulator n=1 Tax=Rhodoligotrophos appendicifer TaxID=987056 RepID=UPI001478DDBE|nr:TetR/AcrR family transcriptional regulator [Rhodoligotrophos appendicifer]